MGAVGAACQPCNGIETGVVAEIPGSSWAKPKLTAGVAGGRVIVEGVGVGAIIESAGLLSVLLSSMISGGRHGVVLDVP